MIRKIGEKEFREEVMKDEAAVVDFSATWCGPCRMLAPVMEELSGELEGRAKFYNVDVDENPQLAAEFGVSSIPNVLILKKGKVADQSVGFMPGPQMKGWIEGKL